MELPKVYVLSEQPTDERKLNQNIKIFTAWATILKLMFVTWITTLPRNTVKECSHKSLKITRALKCKFSAGDMT